MNLKKYEELVYEQNFETPQENRIELGNYIKKLRISQDISLTQLADLAKINISDLHKIEHGTKIKINPFQLKKLAKLLNVDYKSLYRIVNFLDEEDFNNDNLISVEKLYTANEVEKILSSFYLKITPENIKLLLHVLDNSSERTLDELFSFLQYLKTKK
ncbi:hypothetical protein HMPREF0202_01224 [Cetobacterium somerae ATCC BAA-474]|uniref:HTH cro/C1-type domain-containing protein n=1 Tax=Cetobacterium somerae ATCC BAA-474 TaxID=1319815 RepID=U7VBJ6_9FUSO|nr:helix-turn-helix transcriptional regulator [Cetobacterium somerae]ERT68900.1 hypothetical protein HMPREF0202_01224 [Cetobacterium somerae ATCC BAA-474]